MSRELRVGWRAGVLSGIVILHAAVIGALAGIAPASLGRLTVEMPWPIGGTFAPEPFSLLVLALGVTLLSLLVLGILTEVRGHRLQTGAEGRGRLIVLGGASVLHVLATVPVLVLARQAIREIVDSGFAMVHPSQLLLSLPAGTEPFFYVLSALGLLALVVTLSATAASWFLLPERARAIAFVAVDAVLLAAFIVVTAALPIRPPEEAPDAALLPAIRLTITALFAIRLLVRLVGPLLRLVESAGFQPLVAARHLRARKSSFLAAIGMLSVMAVAFSSCSLTTTLSVMGGFRQDLKNKILGNHAHIVIDREHGTFEGWAPVLERTRGIDGVEAAAPFVTGEVMVSSASNLAGAVLRGVQPGEVGNVLDLEDNIVCPQSGARALDYLEHPGKLLHIPPEERRCGEIPLQIPVKRLEEGEPEPEPASGRTVLEQVEQVGAEAAGAEGEPDSAPAPPPPTPDVDEFQSDADRDVLPGIIVGQELARTLRLYVGDEVNVVSPFGDLGPTGPMPKSRPFRVAGVFYSGMYEYDMKYSYVTLPVGQRFLNVGDSINGIEITADHLEAAPAVADRVRGTLGRDDLRVRDWQELNKNLFGALALERLAMFVTLGIAILVAGFCVFGTLTLMVQEKAREVGILKAMGTSRRTVVGVFLIEGVLIGLMGAAAGLGLGYLVGFAAKHFRIVPINPEVYYIDKLPVHMDPLDFTLVGVAAVVVCLLATIFPAVLASRLRPVEALRYD